MTKYMIKLTHDALVVLMIQARQLPINDANSAALRLGQNALNALRENYREEIEDKTPEEA